VRRANGPRFDGVKYRDYVPWRRHGPPWGARSGPSAARAAVFEFYYNLEAPRRRIIGLLANDLPPDSVSPDNLSLDSDRTLRQCPVSGS